MEKEYFQIAKKGLAQWISKRNEVKEDPYSVNVMFSAMPYDGDRNKMSEDIARKIKFYQDLIAKGKMN